MIEFFVKHRITTIMFVLVFVVLGVYSYSNLMIEKTPKIDFPIVTVSVTYPGATPLEVETQVVKKIEDAISEVSEIKKIKSQSYDSFGYIFVEFLLSADVNIKSIEVKDKVEAILNDLPDAVEKPVIEKYDPLIEPVLDMVLTSDSGDLREVYEYADKTLKNKFSSIRGVAKVDVYGGKKRQVNVWLDPMLMKQHYISINEVVAALMARNKNVPAGDIEKGFDALSVRFTGEFQSVEEIADTRLVSSDGGEFKLKDVARVEDSYKKISSIARYNGKEVVALSVNKASDGNAVYIAQEMKRRLPALRKELPQGMHLDIATDTTTFIVNETADTEWNIFIGIILTIALLLLFLGRWDMSFISAIIIPTSIISTFFPMWGSGFSINMMTLLAIATVLGTLISNALVILENVMVHLSRHESPEQAAIDGTKEVFIPIIASTGTNLVVFLPIAMMGGIVGLMMRSFGLTVVYATCFSLLASFALTPMLCAAMLRPAKDKKPAGPGVMAAITAKVKILPAWIDRGMERLKQEYKHIFELMFRFPRLTIVLSGLALIGSFLLMPFVENDFAPKSDEDKIVINFSLPQGSTIERTEAAVKQIEVFLETIPEKKAYLVNIGDNGVENAKITLDLVPSTQRKRSDLKIIDTLMNFLSRIPDVEASCVRQGMGSMTDGDVAIDLYGTDYAVMADVAGQMKEVMFKSGNFQSIILSYKAPKKEMSLKPSEQKLNEFGLNAASVGAVMRYSIYGEDSNVYKENGEEYKVNVELDDRYARDFDDIKEISILSRKGLIPINELGELKTEKAIPTIWRRDRQRIIRIDGYLGKSSLGIVSNDLDRKFKAIKFPAGYSYRYSGESEYMAESNTELGRAGLLAVILTFMLLCAIMNSLIAYPLAVMVTVLTSVIGMILGLFFLNQSINVASMMGMVMLVGMVVNNAILLLDQTLVKRREGLPVKDALWQGASDKFRAIIMTSLAIILGVVPQMWSLSKVKQSMGAVMIGGMLASIVFTFVLVPALFWYLERFEGKFLRKRTS
ncbi:MAG: efflux RND transporter permease subunit [Candidatus Omnitrophica bacterium]|jgi:HAE1 family hydrophobic/amphiphilic exporter-1|nr:efflux RND transporter permease subunit [Candidatus Omnitrophota bacterium]MDD5526021.1 efflux RND transporter permease subunit [Candidatus Omnitrophota bacterium]